MTERITILDCGYLQLVEHWGSDERIIEAARMSTGKGFLGWESDLGLLRRLWTKKHATPFEMAGAVIEVQAPIMVFREWHRHRTQSYNEMSARYTPLPDLNYIPSVERLMMNQGTKNKQAGTIADALPLTEENAYWYRAQLEIQYDRDQNLYDAALRLGVPKELARVHLPVGRYSRMRASANLRNWLAFLTLRMADDAQWEIRQYANALCNVLKELFPRTLELFLEGKNV
jgi:thymidylate synthase (FAD)